MTLMSSDSFFRAINIGVYAILLTTLDLRITKAAPETWDSFALKGLLCRERSAIHFVQEEQLQRAREEVFGSSQQGFAGKDLGFYDYSYGAMDVLIGGGARSKRNRKGYTSLVYYRLYKNANDNIRSILYKYAFAHGGNGISASNLTESQLLKCVHFGCTHPALHVLPPGGLQTIYFSSKEKRFPFTFVREPISRFISAVTEIEYRMETLKQRRKKASAAGLQRQAAALLGDESTATTATTAASAVASAAASAVAGGKNLNGTSEPPIDNMQDTAAIQSVDASVYDRHLEIFQHPLGSQLRFQEIIRRILMTGGSQTLFKRNTGGMEINHIMPVVGTLTLAASVETEPMKLFRVERFEAEWNRLSNLSAVPMLQQFYRTVTDSEWQKLRHPSSDDPFKTSFAAKNFLAHASADALERYYLARPTIGSSSDDHSHGSSSHGSSSHVSSSHVSSFMSSDTAHPRVRLTTPAGVNLSQYKESAQLYLKALCRLYLTDYACTGYQLPADCLELQDELHLAVEDYMHRRRAQQLQRQQDWSLLALLRYFLSEQAMEVVSEVLCFFATSPQCDVAVIHGKELEAYDGHEEL